MQHNRRDEDGHKFVVPEELLEEFDRLMELREDAEWLSDEWYDLTGEFNDKFHQYNVGR